MKKRLCPMLATSALVVAATAACATASRSVPGNTAPAADAVPRHTAADVHFMSAMIPHHAQALLMAGWAPTHGASPAVRTAGERITVSQRDEIAFMQRWLRERDEVVPEADPSGDSEMPGMDHAMLGPGMLTAEQLEELDRARGPEFDRLFLTFMIRHHQGAVAMVEELFSAAGAAQDHAVFQFAADVNADQIAEIDRMSQMLAALSAEGS